MNLFANAVAAGEGKQSDSFRAHLQNKISIATYRRESTLMHLIDKQLEVIETEDKKDNYSQMRDEDLQIIPPFDPVIWKDLLKHMNIDWTQLKYYSEDEN